MVEKAQKVVKVAKLLENERKRKPPVPVEKRARPHKRHANADVISRIHRAISQRLYLVNQEDVSNEESGLCRKYAVLGSTGNVYDVLIGKLPHCSCPDCGKGRLCKHIIFVMVKVLQVSQNSEYVYQNALLQTELAEIFASAPQSAASVVQAKKEVIKAYKKSIGAEEDDEKEVVVELVEKLPEGDCPVCFEDLNGGEALDSCATCRNFIHRDCLKMWLAVQESCCYCRGKWCAFGSKPVASRSSSGTADEGYINLAAMQGLSGRRDTSTYSSGRYGYRYGYYDGGYDDEEG